jgi:type II secretory pathway pseudopilin PulG
MRGRRRRRGSSFIEVLIALVLLAIGGTALITLLGQTAHSIESVSASELQIRAAADQLGALSILDRAELTARVGQRTVRDFSLTIERVAPDLFDVKIATSDKGFELLKTTLYRPDTTDDSSR